MDLAGGTPHLSAFSDEPVFNVKAVCMRTGVAAATLRAWERRYGVPAPKRTEHGYRLYSERDIAIVAWLVGQLEQGITIGQAVAQLSLAMSHGQNPTIPVTSSALTSQPRSPNALTHDLVDAFTTLNETWAENILNEASALYTLETTLIDILRSALAAMRMERQHHKAPITAERFAISYSRQRLRSMIQNAPSPRNGASLLLIGLREEHTEIDLLIIHLLLRRHGWPVTYMGNDLDPTLLASSVAGQTPPHPHPFPPISGIFCLIDSPQHITQLGAVGTHVGPLPVYMCGGRAFEEANHAYLIHPFEYIGADLRVIVRALLDYLNRGATQTRFPAGMLGD